MEHIFEAFQNSFQKDEKAIFIANVKNEQNEEGDLMLTNKRMVFYPAKPKEIKDVLFINIDLIDSVERTDKGLIISSGDKKGTYEIEHLKEDFIQKLQGLNSNIQLL